MYTQTWSKYLPVIKILLKRSLSGDQHLNLNVPDFEKKGARKVAEKFSMRLNKGKLNDSIRSLEIAKDLAFVLLNNAEANELISRNDYQISMNSKFQLSIQFIPEVIESIPSEA
jgi:hypothetical protein